MSMKNLMLEQLENARRIATDGHENVPAWRVETPEGAPIRQMQGDLLAEPPLRADAVAVADDEHPDHRLGIDRRTPDVTVVGLQLLVQIGERDRHETLIRRSRWFSGMRSSSRNS
jgi:hypothetical protein